MNKNKKIIFIILSVIILLGIIVGLAYYFRYGRTYELNLPQLEKLESISLNQNNKDSIISDKEEMEDILYVLNGIKRVTKNESIQDSPVNVENGIKIDFDFIEIGTSRLFVYTKNDRYYIEQPYNGIYQISRDEYNSIEKYVRVENND